MVEERVKEIGDVIDSGVKFTPKARELVKRRIGERRGGAVAGPEIQPIEEVTKDIKVVEPIPTRPPTPAEIITGTRVGRPVPREESLAFQPGRTFRGTTVTVVKEVLPSREVITTVGTRR